MKLMNTDLMEVHPKLMILYWTITTSFKLVKVSVNKTYYLGVSKLFFFIKRQIQSGQSMGRPTASLNYLTIKVE